MLKELNPWVRLWLMSLTVLLATTLALIAAAWPGPDAEIVANLRSPDCQAWREAPAGVFPETYPNAGDPCFALRVFLLEKRVAVRSEDDYADYLTGQGFRTAGKFLGIWAGLTAGIYLLGWSTYKLVGRVSLRRRERQRG